jgi:hypothetical protein
MSKKVNVPSERSTLAARREKRLAREAALLEEGRADIREGRCISGEAADAWLDGLHGKEGLPIPGRPVGKSYR